MKFEEIDKSLLNGFHDSLLKSIEIDFIKRKFILKMDIDLTEVPSAGEVEIPKHQAAILTVNNFFYVFLEPPDFKYDDHLKPGPIRIDIGPRGQLRENTIEELLPIQIKKDQELHWVFLTNWSCFIFFSGEDYIFEWEEKKKHLIRKTG